MQLIGARAAAWHKLRGNFRYTLPLCIGVCRYPHRVVEIIISTHSCRSNNVFWVWQLKTCVSVVVALLICCIDVTKTLRKCCIGVVEILMKCCLDVAKNIVEMLYWCIRNIDEVLYWCSQKPFVQSLYQNLFEHGYLEVVGIGGEVWRSSRDFSVVHTLESSL